MSVGYKLKEMPWPTHIWVDSDTSRSGVARVAHPDRPKQWTEVARGQKIILASRKPPEKIATVCKKSERIYIARYDRWGSVRRRLWGRGMHP